MSDEISLCRAYRLARDYYRRKWIRTAQYHLSAVGEGENVWVIAFFAFIPEPIYTGFHAYQKCELAGIKGIIPAYYDSNPDWIEVNKTTGICQEVLYMGYDWLFGKGKEYEDSLTWTDRQKLFDYRSGQGQRFHLVVDEKISSCYEKC